MIRRLLVWLGAACGLLAPAVAGDFRAVGRARGEVGRGRAVAWFLEHSRAVGAAAGAGAVSGL